jgi:hypothetical protein
MSWNKVCSVVSFFGITSIISGSGGGKAIWQISGNLGKSFVLVYFYSERSEGALTRIIDSRVLGLIF